MYAAVVHIGLVIANVLGANRQHFRMKPLCLNVICTCLHTVHLQAYKNKQAEVMHKDEISLLHSAYSD